MITLTPTVSSTLRIDGLAGGYGKTDLATLVSIEQLVGEGRPSRWSAGVVAPDVHTATSRMMSSQ